MNLQLVALSFAYGLASVSVLALPWAVRNGMLVGPEKLNSTGTLVGWVVWIAGAGLAACVAFWPLSWLGQQRDPGFIGAAALFAGGVAGCFICRAAVNKLAPVVNALLANPRLRVGGKR
jgi:hypothetical protein